MNGMHNDAAAEMEAYVVRCKKAAALKAANAPPSEKKKSKRELKKEKKASDIQKSPPNRGSDGAADNEATKKSSEKGLSKKLSSRFFKKKKKKCQAEAESDCSEIGDNTQSSSTVAEKSEEELAMEKIQQTIERQERREEALVEKMKKLVVEGKTKLSAGDKKGALFAMKKKKFHDDELDKLQQAKFTMETQILKIESAIENRAMYEAMATGSNTMKKLHSDVGVDDVDEIMENIREEMESALEINEALVQEVNPEPFDDEALLAELMATEMSVEMSIEMPIDPSNSLYPEDVVGALLPRVPSATIEPLNCTPDSAAKKSGCRKEREKTRLLAHDDDGEHTA